jgi:tRNA(fMet)-specific endonuclease VapC
MQYLLDTDTCVYWSRGHVPLLHQVAQAHPASLAILAVTLAELRYGAASSARVAANQAALDVFAKSLPVLSVDEAVAARFGDVKAALRRQGTLIEDCDLFIAATALAYTLTLVTNNVDHFGRITGLEIDNWV